MAGTAKLKLNFGFVDDTERAVEIPNLDPSVSAADIKAKVKAFDVDAVSDTFISDAGSALSAVIAATLTKVTETDINLKVSE